MNITLMYSQYFLHKSYFEDLYTKQDLCPNILVKLDRKKARDLLSQAGWVVNPKTGFLEKNNKRFSFKFLTRDASSEKFLAIYAEDLKNVGIELTIDKKDWAAWARDMDEFNYQMTWAAWGAGIFKDPEGMWSSKEATRKGGSNITGFENSLVDELIKKQKSIFDVAKRNEIYRKIDQIVYNAFPYVLLWNINYTRLLYWNKFGVPDTVLSKYGDESSAYWYWWLDEDSAADLSDAMKNRLPLPQREPTIYFADFF
jgi:microcin C transport system substrate-binding protein